MGQLPGRLARDAAELFRRAAVGSSVRRSIAAQSVRGPAIACLWAGVGVLSAGCGPAGRGGAIETPHARATRVVEARLTSRTLPPTPGAIRPYRYALGVNVYEVTRVISGRAEAGRIMVAHWAVRDGRPVAGFADLATGEVYRLRLDRFGAYPQLQEALLLVDPDVFDLELYYDVASPEPAGPAGGEGPDGET